jgi:signal transduction histidine kinase
MGTANYNEASQQLIPAEDRLRASRRDNSGARPYRSARQLSRFLQQVERPGKEPLIHQSEGELISKSNLLWWPKPPAVLRYGVAVLSVIAALIISRLLDIYLVTAPASLFLCAIMFSAWFGGIRPGLLAVALSLLGFKYYFVTPLYSLAVEIKEVPRLIIFILSSLFVGALSAAQRRATESLRSARDDLSRAVQELRGTNEALHAENAERQRAEEALRNAQADLAHATRVTTLGELAASIAHEVNQPITASVTNAKTCVRWLAGDAPNIEEARDAAMRSAKNGTRAAEIIGRIRLLFQKGGAKRELVDVNEVIEEMVLLLRVEATRYSVSIRTDFAADLPQVMADRVQLPQVIMNLIMNSIEATKDIEGPREIVVKSEPAENEQLLVSVSDTGVGLPTEQADRVFDAFFTTKLHGTGMGLSISRSIVESHGGRLWVNGNAPRGATFHITLPTRVEAQLSSTIE